MIAIDYINEQEIKTRFDVLPKALKDALTSERNLDVVNEICQKNRVVDEEKILIIHQIVGLVILGFVHYYDVNSEINDELGINNPQFSASMAEELKAKIFSPIKNDLENNYHPVLANPPKKEDDGPKVIQDMKPLGSSPIASVPPAAPVATMFKVGGVPPPAPQIKNVPTPASVAVTPPKSLSDVGWSKASPTMPTFQTPKGNFGTEALLSSIPRPSVTPQKAPATEFNRLGNMQQQTPEAAPMPAAPTAAAARATAPAAPMPGPVIIHEDATFKPTQQQTPNFRIAMPQERFDVQKNQPPVRAAIVELPNARPAQQQQKPAAPSTQQPFSPPRTPVASQGPRQITEITANPATPSKPVTLPPIKAVTPAPSSTWPPSTQQQTPTAQQPKVVQKDYLEPPQAPQTPQPPKPPGQ